jgi:elongation factor 3
LDVQTVAWLEQYLCNLPDITCMIVSHDSGFLDNVCTDIVSHVTPFTLFGKADW